MSAVCVTPGGEENRGGAVAAQIQVAKALGAWHELLADRGAQREALKRWLRSRWGSVSAVWVGE